MPRSTLRAGGAAVAIAAGFASPMAFAQRHATSSAIVIVAPSARRSRV